MRMNYIYVNIAYPHALHAVHTHTHTRTHTTRSMHARIHTQPFALITAIAG